VWIGPCRPWVILSSGPAGPRKTTMRSYGLFGAVALLLAACSSQQPAPPPGPSAPAPGGQTPIRVLMVTATAGFRHDAIPAAREVMAGLAVSGGEFTVTATEDLSSLTASSLAAYDVLFFALTSGELAIGAEQRAAIVSFVSDGKGFLGVHSASDTLYEWPDYGRLVGAYFKEHPWTRLATVVVEDTAHPATAGLGDRFGMTEEYYTFRENPRQRVRVLLRLDADSVGAAGDFPLAWAQSFGAGRAYYNALGHFPETWRDQRFQRQLAGAIRWAAQR
jgi:type 1 glutamine amidotransferase